MTVKYYVCKKMRLLTFLQQKGFQFIKAQNDRENPLYVVWIFEDTPELRSTIEEYYSTGWFKK